MHPRILALFLVFVACATPDDDSHGSDTSTGEAETTPSELESYAFAIPLKMSDIGPSWTDLDNACIAASAALNADTSPTFRALLWRDEFAHGEPDGRTPADPDATFYLTTCANRPGRYSYSYFATSIVSGELCGADGQSLVTGSWLWLTRCEDGSALVRDRDGLSAPSTSSIPCESSGQLLCVSS